MQVADHGKVALAQLTRQRRVQRGFGTVGRDGRVRRFGGRGGFGRLAGLAGFAIGAQIPVLARSLGVGSVQAVLIGAGIHMATGEHERVLAGLRRGAGAIDGADHLDAVARGQRAKPIQVGDLQRGLTAGDGGGAAEDQPVTHAGAVAERSAHAQRAVVARVGARHRQGRARCRAHQRDHAPVVQSRDTLAETGEIQRGAAGHRVNGCRAEGVGRPRPQCAGRNIGGAGVVVGAGKRQGATAVLGEKARTTDGPGERGIEGAGVDHRIVAARQADRIGDAQPIGGNAERGAVVHRECAGP